MPKTTGLGSHHKQLTDKNLHFYFPLGDGYNRGSFSADRNSADGRPH